MTPAARAIKGTTALGQAPAMTLLLTGAATVYRVGGAATDSSSSWLAWALQALLDGPAPAADP